MRKEYSDRGRKPFKISVYGSKKDIDIAIEELNKINLTGDEGMDRIIIQHMIDLKNVKADILYDGNGVWSKKRVIRDLKRALKSKPCKVTENGSGDYTLTNYLYQFLTLCCGSIAHYNKYGWIGEYPTKADLRNFFKCNEFGQSVVNNQPRWKTDCINIANEILNTV